MGLETTTTATQGRKRYEGKLYLDSKSLTFRSKAFRWEAILGSTVNAESSNGRLIVQSGDDVVRFEVGAAAPKWVDKINHPPTRVTKLGIKPDHRFWVSKGFSKSFVDELKATGASHTRKRETCDIAFWKVTHRIELQEFDEIADSLAPGVNLWIVWTKGSEAINQNEVMKEAKSRGFGPSKTAAFDDQHSSMRYARKRS